jgi:hypothetical protein
VGKLVLAPGADRRDGCVDRREGGVKKRAERVTLDDAAVGRILAAVGTVPADLDRDGLRTDLESAASLYRTGADVRVQPATRKKDVLRMIARVKSLKSDLGDDLRYLRHKKALDHLIDELNSEFPPKLTRLLSLNRGSAFDNLVGKWLRHTFERHFRTDATPGSRNSNTGVISGSPFVDFVQAALKELQITNKNGKPYSRNSIHVAATYAR